MNHIIYDQENQIFSNTGMKNSILKTIEKA